MPNFRSKSRAAVALAACVTIATAFVTGPTVATAQTSGCAKATQISPKGEIDEPEGPLNGFEMSKTTTVTCRR